MADTRTDDQITQDYKAMGETKDRGLMGIIDALDPMQNSIYVLE